MAAINIKLDGSTWLRAGDKRTLTATADDPGAAPTDWTWQHAGTTLGGQTDPSLTVTMSRDHSEAGSYGVSAIIGGQRVPSESVTLRATSLWVWLGALVGGGLPIILIFAVYAGLSVLLLGQPHWHIGSFRVWYPSAGWQRARSWIFASLTLVTFLGLVDLLGRMSANGQSGLVTMFLGDDNRASTSKAQYLAWTLVVGLALAYDAANSAITNMDFSCSTKAGAQWHNCVPSNNFGAYLLLLGVPAGAAVVSKGLVSYKMSQGTLQKTDGSGASLTDLTTNDQGRTDLVDTQYLLFNLIAIAYVLAKFVPTGVLPSVPDLLLGLTSTSAATYVINKGVQSNAPSIRSITPTVVAPEAQLTIRGDNLVVDGAGPVAVTVAGQPAASVQVNRDGSVTCVAPHGLSTQDPTVKVVTAAHVESDPYPIQVASPKVLGWGSSPGKKVGGPASLIVSRLGDKSSAQVMVGHDLYDARVGPSPAGGTKIVTFPLKPTEEGSVPVSVVSEGEVSAPLSLPVT